MFKLGHPLYEGEAGGGAEGGAGGSQTTSQPVTPEAATGNAPAGLGSGFTGLPEKYASDPDFQSFGSVDDVFGEFKNLKAVQANREANGLLEAIGENSTPEQVDAFFKKLGKPGSPAEYEFKAPEDFPQGLDYSDERAAKFAEMAHKHHLTKAQAQGVFADFHEMVKEEYGQMAVHQETVIAENFTQLEAKWGQQGTPQFDANHKNALRAFNYVADAEMAEAFKSNPELASNPLVLDVLSRLGSKMSQDSVPSVSSSIPSGGFADTLPAIERKISEFHSSGKFKTMMSGHSAEADAAKKEWQQLNAHRAELMAKGGA